MKRTCFGLCLPIALLPLAQVPASGESAKHRSDYAGEEGWRMAT